MDDREVSRLADGFRRHFEGASTRPIPVPTDAGAFRDTDGVSPSPVVVDANVLRNDLLYSCRSGRRTILITAAATGTLRLFCARHVIDEVAEHAPRWASEGGVQPQALARTWAAQYLPLLRIVKVERLHVSLSREERTRIETLREVDPDDVPSALLALTLGAFFLSQDQPAREAVYGYRSTAQELARWRPIIEAGSAATETERMAAYSALAVELMGRGAVAAVRQAGAALGPLAAPVAAVLALFALKAMTKERRETAGRILAGAANGLFEFAVFRNEMLATFESALPPPPDWREVAQAAGRDAALHRACLHALARVGSGSCSAVELAQELRHHTIPATPEGVRTVLRSGEAFRQVARGRWQVGHPGWGETAILPSP